MTNIFTYANIYKVFTIVCVSIVDVWVRERIEQTFDILSKKIM